MVKGRLYLRYRLFAFFFFFFSAINISGISELFHQAEFDK